MTSIHPQSLSRRWLLTLGAFIVAYLFALGVTAAIRTFRLPSSDTTWIALSFGIPCIIAFALFERHCFVGYRAFARITLSGIFSAVFAALAFWLAFITEWGVFGGSAP